MYRFLYMKERFNHEFHEKFVLLQALRVHSILVSARSALFNWLLARKEKAHLYCALKIQILKLVLRESEENIKASLQWLGMNWDRRH